MEDSAIILIVALVIMVPLVLFMGYMAVDAWFIRPRREKVVEKSGETLKRLRLERASGSSLSSSYRSSRHHRNESSFSLNYPDEAGSVLSQEKVQYTLPSFPSIPYGYPASGRRKEEDLEAALLLPTSAHHSENVLSITFSFMSKKDQYHHFIPRFILREFQTGSKKTNKERQEEFKKTGIVNERVYFYQPKTGTLENRLIGTVYGVTNLYRDITNIEQVDEIEEKFSKLESHCAKLIQGLHKRLDGSATEQRSFPITRQDLGQLRKFLFLMHFRNSGLQGSYFDPEHPHHRGVRDALEKRWAQVPGAKVPKDVWLDAMRYYLNTSHAEILLQVSERAPANADFVTLLTSLRPHTVENADLMDAITYHQQADMYHLAILQAAPGHEFVLGNNTFGLWEGIMGEGTISQHGVHRVYVASPRIALILRMNLYLDAVRSPELVRDTRSDLLSISLSQAQCTFGFHGNEGFRGMAQYRASLAAQNDLFTFPIKKLTSAETFLVNAVVLQNIGIMGSLTFKDPSCLHLTLHQFWKLGSNSATSPIANINRLIRNNYLSLMRIVGDAIRGQPEDFDIPVNRVFLLSQTGGEAKATTAAEARSKGAIRKKKGKGRSTAVTLDSNSGTQPASAHAAKERVDIAAITLKRVEGNIPAARQRYEESLEAWKLMHHDATELTDLERSCSSLFDLTANRFKKLAEPILHFPRAPGFSPSPNARLRTSSEIISDETIKAIWDKGGRWFDEWEDRFRLRMFGVQESNGGYSERRMIAPTRAYDRSPLVLNSWNDFEIDYEETDPGYRYKSLTPLPRHFEMAYFGLKSFLTLLPALISVNAYQIDVWDNNFYAGTQKRYTSAGTHLIGFQANSYKWINGAPNCCVSFCNGNLQTEYWCESHNNQLAAGFTRIVIGCNGNPGC
ncbi:hypothetical protein CVT24_004825 [Panaeolus cyanescens]|uniref:Uncharacterized protein n=1 Tax=Panaeolus cyanescens TaxID=181874 RepID=A0A409W1W2_9AGAR|nr:hypothetical protein CVT24_004825 [Panaeolus cyanescens]